MYLHTLTILPFALFQLASAADSTAHDVTVGANAQLLFSPSIVTAAVGDKVNFHFFPSNHSVSQSTFGAPCVPSSSLATFSGFQPTASESTEVFTVTVNDTKPIWIYCAQDDHCGAGMAMVINQPSAPNTLANYLIAAESAKTVAPSTVGGGVFTENLSSGSGSSSVSSAGGSSSTSTGSSAGTSSTSIGSTTASGPYTTPTAQKSNGAAEARLQWGVLGLSALMFGGQLL